MNMIRLSLLVVTWWLCHADQAVDPVSGPAEPENGGMISGQYSNSYIQISALNNIINVYC